MIVNRTPAPKLPVCDLPAHRYPLPRFVRAVILRASHPLIRARLLWLTVAWALCVALLIIGVGYWSGVFTVPSTSRAYVIVQHFLPGKMRTQGAVETVAGVALLYCLGPTVYGLPEKPFIHWVLTLPCFTVFGWTAFAFAAAPLAHGTFGPAGVVQWLLCAMLCQALVLLPPPSKGETDLPLRSGRA